MKEILDRAFAKRDTDDDAKEITERYFSGRYNDRLTAEGMDPVPIKKPKMPKVNLKAALANQQEGLQTMIPEPEPVATRIAKDVPSDIKEVGDFSEKIQQARGAKIGKILRSEDLNVLEKGMSTLSQVVLGSIADAIAIGSTGAIKTFATPELEEDMKNLAQSVGENENVQSLIGTYTTWYEGLSPESKNMIDAVAPVAEVASEITLAGKVVKPAKEAGQAVVTGTKESIKAGVKTFETGMEQGAKLQSVAGGVVKKLTPDTSGMTSTQIEKNMGLGSTDRQKFFAQQGKSEGEYLLEKGIVGNREQTAKQLSENFTALRENVDDGLSNIPGNHRDSRVTVVAEDIAKYMKDTSSPEATEFAILADKARGVGLDMSEMNKVKRAFERNIKMSYYKDPTVSSKVAQSATNKDKALREFQFEIASKGGFDNLAELNKDIQASKSLMDSIGKNIIGEKPPNNMNLSDWFILSGGASNPAFFAGFLVKKVLSTETVKIFATRLLAGFPKVKPIKRADMETILERARETYKKQDIAERKNKESILLYEELKNSGFKMGGKEGLEFVLENPIALTQQEQHLLKQIKFEKEYRETVNFILEERNKGNAVGEGFTIENIDNTGILNPQSRFDPYPLDTKDPTLAPTYKRPDTIDF